MDKHRVPLRDVIQQVRSTQWHKTLFQLLQQNKLVRIKTLHGSLPSFVTAALREEIQQPFIILTSPDLVEQWVNDLHLLDFDVLACIPPRKPHHNSPGELVQAYDVLSYYTHARQATLILTPQSWQLTLPTPAWFKQNSLNLRVGDELPFDEFRQLLLLGGYQRSDYVNEVGEMSVRGGIIDLYPLGSQLPLRFEFWGDRIESLRQFDPLSQRSVRNLDQTTILGAYPRDESQLTASIEEFIPRDATIIITYPNEIYNLFHEFSITPSLEQYHRLEINPLGKADVAVNSAPQPSCQSSAIHFYNHLCSTLQAGACVTICADSRIHLERLRTLLSNLSEQQPPENQLPLERIAWITATPTAGFLLPHDAIALITEHEVFERQPARQAPARSRAALTIRQLQQLRRGDYLVHIDKGICQFDGLETIEIGGHKHECVRLLFAGGDVVYLNLNYINKLERYTASEGNLPSLSKLGTKQWEHKKARIKRRIKDIARDLIKLYALRKASLGFEYPPDTIWQTELEASFMYEDTPDQARATAETKRDMESPTPMDRLICGDVGFGKTEIAIRAAFKAVQAGKQVAVLVPTTILARQHYTTFSERLSRYPVRVDVLSRMRHLNEQRAIVKDLAEGRIDIIIGTHRLLSNDVQFRDLGLLIIDEEQRFGVAAKEKLRQLRVNIDTLTLTATPIPRTLHFSLMGARDLSIIETPPRNRLPITTEIIEWDQNTLNAAITRELERNGQVFIVNDSIEGIPALQQRLLRMIPTLRIGIAHGQLTPSALESVMERFLERKYDALLSTKIIENGLDIPNVNTIIIVNAERFGLAELYQLRGRVGRTNRQAYCYLVVESLRDLSKQALQRLQAVEEFTELGSGFHLALRDMEIRGVGNVFGAEQSGFIADVGFETYHRILEEAVAELHSEEFADLFADRPQTFINDNIVIELPFDALLPASYIPYDTDRFEWYKRLYRCATPTEVNHIAEELRDRYGPIPEQAENLLYAVRLRVLGAPLGLERIRVEDSLLHIELPAAAPLHYYEKMFPIIIAASAELHGGRIRQVGKTALIEVPLVHQHQALDVLSKLTDAIEHLQAQAGTASLSSTYHLEKSK